MHSQLLEAQLAQTYIVIFEVDDPTEVITGLTDFARRYQITAASITAIGMFTHTIIGYFERELQQYRPITISENVEVISLLGDIALDVEKNEPKVHLHALLGLSDGSTKGGHLLEAHVGVTLEVVVNVLPTTLRRLPHKEIGLTLIELGDNHV
jgi:uncharacterized protein